MSLTLNKHGLLHWVCNQRYLSSVVLELELQVIPPLYCDISSSPMIEAILNARLATKPGYWEVRNVIIVGSWMLTGTDPFGEFTKFCIKFTLFVDTSVNFQQRQKDMDISEEYFYLIDEWD
jgi:hypothetical protein